MFDSITKYYPYFDSNAKKSMRLFLLLNNIQNYVNGSILEIRRLEKHRSEMRRFIARAQGGNFSRKNKFLHTYLACDTHFFFICIDKIYKLLHNLYEETGDVEIKSLETRIKDTFEIKTIRNHLEHIEDRCLGFLTPSRKKRVHISDFGNFIGDDFSFHGKRFPSSKKSLDEVRGVFKDLIKIIEKRCKQDPNFIKRQAIDRDHRKISRALKKAGLLG